MTPSAPFRRQFPVGFAGSSTACTGSYAVLPLSRARPPLDWFFGLGYEDCVDPPLGIAQQVRSRLPESSRHAADTVTRLAEG